MLLGDGTETEYRKWPAGSGSRSVRFRVAAAQALHGHVCDSARALRRRGLETGGFLIGTSSGDGVLVRSVRPILSEYPEGPAFRVDEETLRQQLREAAAQGPVVGIYRSRTDGVIEPDDQDRFLLRLIASGTPALIVLFRAGPDSPAEALMGFSDGVTEQWQGSLHPWASAMLGGEHRVVSTDIVPAERSVTVVPSQPPIKGWPALRRPPSRAPLYFTAAGLAGVLLAGSVWMYRKRETAYPANAPVQYVFGTGNLVKSPTTPEKKQPAVQRPKPPAQQMKEDPALEVRSRQNEQAARFSTFQLPPVRRSTVASPQLLPSEGLPSVSARSEPLAPVLPSTVAPPAPANIPRPASNPTTEFVPPVVTHQGGAVIIAPELWRLVQREIVLQLNVSVDASGKVRSVIPITTNDPVEQSLSRTYANALRSWMFEPARRNGVAVPADTILKFRIQPAR